MGVYIGKHYEIGVVVEAGSGAYYMSPASGKPERQICG